MTRTFLPRALGAAAIVAGLVTALTLFAGSGLAQGSAAQANYAPTNTALPTIGGNAQVGQVLTAANGTWNSQTTPTFTYQWQRCNASGASCASITGATVQTYTLATADLASTARVVVTATDPSGSSSATSAQTAVVTTAGPEGAIKLQDGTTSVPASSVALPERLIIDSVKYSTARLTSRAPFVGRFHIADTRGYMVRDALVMVTALPYAWARSGAEVRTDQSGWATVTISPTVNMPLGRNALVMFVRARVETQSLLAGSSTRRLVQIGIH